MRRRILWLVEQTLGMAIRERAVFRGEKKDKAESLQLSADDHQKMTRWWSPQILPVLIRLGTSVLNDKSRVECGARGATVSFHALLCGTVLCTQLPEYRRDLCNVRRALLAWGPLPGATTADVYLRTGLSSATHLVRETVVFTAGVCSVSRSAASPPRRCFPCSPHVWHMYLLPVSSERTATALTLFASETSRIGLCDTEGTVQGFWWGMMEPFCILIVVVTQIYAHIIIHRITHQGIASFTLC